MSEEKKDDSAQAIYKKWVDQFASARRNLQKWEKEAKKVVKKFRDDRGDEESMIEGDTRLNLFFANTTTLQAMLYGSVPKVNVDRKFSDPNDDQARVAALMANRILQQDIEYAGEDFATALRAVLEDRLIPGLGTARVRYEFDEQSQEVPEQKDPVTGVVLAPAFTKPIITNEKVEIVYVHWQDYLYSPARVHSEIWWKAYRSYMDRDALVERFGEELGSRIPLNSDGPVDKQNGPEQAHEEQAEVWEIWNKKTRKVEWIVEGFDQCLDTKDDPLQLDGFFPEPPPFIANTTTSKYVPRSDFAMAQDLYNEIDFLQSRISLLTEACKVIGAYDKSVGSLSRIFQEGVENELIPVDNWALLGEKGGLKGVIDWVPIEQVANVIKVLDERLAVKIQQLYEITGMSDVIRGASQPYEAAATSKVKAQFASIKVQKLQDEFARFASDLQSLKLEIIQKHFQPQSIIEQSNILLTPDAALAGSAIQLLKDRSKARWRIQIKPESLALADYAQLKADRVDYINGVSLFLQSSKPLMELDKRAAPYLLELMKWGLAGFKGAQEIEGVMDQAIKQFTEIAKQPDPPQQDPAMEKVKMEMQLAQQEHQAKMQQESARMENERREFQMKADLERERAAAERDQDERRFQQEMVQMREKHNLEMEALRAKLQVQRESAEIKMTEQTHAAAVQMESRDAEARADRRDSAN